jgi:hypothetical protein
MVWKSYDENGVLIAESLSQSEILTLTRKHFNKLGYKPSMNRIVNESEQEPVIVNMLGFDIVGTKHD